MHTVLVRMDGGTSSGELVRTYVTGRYVPGSTLDFQLLSLSLAHQQHQRPTTYSIQDTSTATIEGADTGVYCLASIKQTFRTSKEIMAASDDLIDTFFNSIRDLHSVRNSLDIEFSSSLKDIIKRAAKDISHHTGEFLHRLEEKKPDEDTLQKMISASPSSLNYVNAKGHLPIHSALDNCDSVRYAPLLAKEGVKLKVGGEAARGGLLAIHPASEYGGNTLECLGRCGYDDNPKRDQVDEACVDVMKKLREVNLLTNEDVRDYNLLYYTAYSQGGKLRFNFLSDWCPEGLKDYQCRGLPMIHAIIKNLPIQAFAIFLKAATKHHVNEAGLLFQTNNDGTTACERAFDRFDKEKVMQVIGNCIPFDDPQLPILHHVVKHAPKLYNEFLIRYTSAAYLRGSDGRNLNQTMLASGNTTFESNGAYFIHTLSDDQVREIDPVTDLYPFMVAASGDTSDLSAVYMLLTRNPSLADGGNIDT